jgi:dimethylglycine dehydrogenase
MKTHARVVVIGGGVVGCSVLYHLTKLGWTDVVLCERKELTAGSSWHAAGGFHALNGDPAVSRLQAYTINLYREIEKLSGQDVGLHFTGGLNVAATRERWDMLRSDWARHRVLGLKTELISPAQIRELCPIMDTREVCGAIYDPQEGHLDPAGATHAYGKAACTNGAHIYRHTRVIEIVPSDRGSWRVVTDAGTIEAEHVVNAAGLWAREVGKMVGVLLPIIPMEHHYLLTEDLAEIKAMGRELPLVLDLDAEIYLRQERNGVLLGVYEKEATPWALDGTSWDYGETELLPPNLDRLTDALEKGFQRFPALSAAGIRRVVNGPFTFTPDGNPLVGPVPGLRHYWAACGVMAGFAQGGGVGLTLAQWITQGEPEGDIFAMDVARFGPYASRHYTVAKAREFYSRRFQIAYPNEYWPAGRPAKTSAAHPILHAAHAVFGVSYGLEVPLYFAEPGDPPTETPTLKRSNAFDRVRAECQSARSSVGLLDVSSFAKYEVRGQNAHAGLSHVLAGRMPEIGRVRLAPMLAHSGRLIGDLTIFRLAEDHFLIAGSGYLQEWHMRWFTEHLLGPGCDVANVSEAYGGIALFGPSARELLRRVSRTDVSDAAFPFMTVRHLDIAFAPAIAARLSVTGELGYEIYVPALYLPSLLEAVFEAGSDIELRHVGLYALNSLRLEKSFGIWSREFSRDYTPRMAGLTRFIDYEREGFIGRSAALRDRERSPEHRLVTIAIEALDGDAIGYEPIELGERLVGYTTSGGYGHCTDISLAMGYLSSAVPDEATGLTVRIAGEVRGCRVLHRPIFDPDGRRMRG